MVQYIASKKELKLSGSTLSIINADISMYLRGFKYDWVWNKVSVSKPQLAKKHPLKNLKMISVFGKGSGGVNYFPHGIVIKIKNPKVRRENIGKNELLGNVRRRDNYVQEYTNHPALALRYPRPSKAVYPI